MDRESISGKLAEARQRIVNNIYKIRKQTQEIIDTAQNIYKLYKPDGGSFITYGPSENLLLNSNIVYMDESYTNSMLDPESGYEAKATRLLAMRSPKTIKKLLIRSGVTQDEENAERLAKNPQHAAELILNKNPELTFRFLQEIIKEIRPKTQEMVPTMSPAMQTLISAMENFDLEEIATQMERLERDPEAYWKNMMDIRKKKKEGKTPEEKDIKNWTQKGALARKWRKSAKLYKQIIDTLKPGTSQELSKIKESVFAGLGGGKRPLESIWWFIYDRDTGIFTILTKLLLIADLLLEEVKKTESAEDVQIFIDEETIQNKIEYIEEKIRNKIQKNNEYYREIKYYRRQMAEGTTGATTDQIITLQKALEILDAEENANDEEIERIEKEKEEINKELIGTQLHKKAELAAGGEISPDTPILDFVDKEDIKQIIDNAKSPQEVIDPESFITEYESQIQKNSDEIDQLQTLKTSLEESLKDSGELLESLNEYFEREIINDVISLANKLTENSEKIETQIQRINNSFERLTVHLARNELEQAEDPKKIVDAINAINIELLDKDDQEEFQKLKITANNQYNKYFYEKDKRPKIVQDIEITKNDAHTLLYKYTRQRTEAEAEERTTEFSQTTTKNSIRDLLTLIERISNKIEAAHKRIEGYEIIKSKGDAEEIKKKALIGWGSLEWIVTEWPKILDKYMDKRDGDKIKAMELLIRSEDRQHIVEKLQEIKKLLEYKSTKAFEDLIAYFKHGPFAYSGVIEEIKSLFPGEEIPSELDAIITQLSEDGIPKQLESLADTPEQTRQDLYNRQQWQQQQLQLLKKYQTKQEYYDQQIAELKALHKTTDLQEIIEIELEKLGEKEIAAKEKTKTIEDEIENNLNRINEIDVGIERNIEKIKKLKSSNKKEIEEAEYTIKELEDEIKELEDEIKELENDNKFLNKQQPRETIGDIEKKSRELHEIAEIDKIINNMGDKIAPELNREDTINTIINIKTDEIDKIEEQLDEVRENQNTASEIISSWNQDWFPSKADLEETLRNQEILTLINTVIDRFSEYYDQSYENASRTLRNDIFNDYIGDDENRPVLSYYNAINSIITSLEEEGINSRNAPSIIEKGVKDPDVAHELLNMFKQSVSNSFWSGQKYLSIIKEAITNALEEIQDNNILSEISKDEYQARFNEPPPEDIYRSYDNESFTLTELEETIENLQKEINDKTLKIAGSGQHSVASYDSRIREYARELLGYATNIEIDIEKQHEAMHPQIPSKIKKEIAALDQERNKKLDEIKPEYHKYKMLLDIIKKSNDIEEVLKTLKQHKIDTEANIKGIEGIRTYNTENRYNDLYQQYKNELKTLNESIELIKKIEKDKPSIDIDDLFLEIITMKTQLLKPIKDINAKIRNAGLRNYAAINKKARSNTLIYYFKLLSGALLDFSTEFTKRMANRNSIQYFGNIEPETLRYQQIYEYFKQLPTTDPRIDDIKQKLATGTLSQQDRMDIQNLRLELAEELDIDKLDQLYDEILSAVEFVQYEGALMVLLNDILSDVIDTHGVFEENSEEAKLYHQLRTDNEDLIKRLAARDYNGIIADKDHKLSSKLSNLFKAWKMLISIDEWLDIGHTYKLYHRKEETPSEIEDALQKIDEEIEKLQNTIKKTTTKDIKEKLEKIYEEMIKEKEELEERYEQIKGEKDDFRTRTPSSMIEFKSNFKYIVKQIFEKMRYLDETADELIVNYNWERLPDIYNQVINDVFDQALAPETFEVLTKNLYKSLPDVEEKDDGTLEIPIDNIAEFVSETALEFKTRISIRYEELSRLLMASAWAQIIFMCMLYRHSNREQKKIIGVDIHKLSKELIDARNAAIKNIMQSPSKETPRKVIINAKALEYEERIKKHERRIELLKLIDPAQKDAKKNRKELEEDLYNLRNELNQLHVIQNQGNDTSIDRFRIKIVQKEIDNLSNVLKTKTKDVPTKISSLKNTVKNLKERIKKNKAKFNESRNIIIDTIAECVQRLANTPIERL